MLWLLEMSDGYHGVPYTILSPFCMLKVNLCNKKLNLNKHKFLFKNIQMHTHIHT